MSCFETSFKYLYKYAANKSVAKASVSPLTDIDCQLINALQEVVVALLLQYKEVFSKRAEGLIVSSPTDFLSEGTGCISHLTAINLSKDDMQQAILGMADNSADGLDHFSAVVRTMCAKELSVPLLHLVSCVIPEELKSATVTPIY